MLKPGTSPDSSTESPSAAPASSAASQPADNPDTEAQTNNSLSAVMTAVLVLLTVAALYFGRNIFLPFALAVLLSFLLAPLVDSLRRLRIPRAAAVLVVVASSVMLIGGLSVLVARQAIDIATNLPAYEKTMQEKIRAFRAATPGSAAFSRSSQVIRELGEELSGRADKPATEKSGAAKSKQEPIPVRIEPVESPFTTLHGMIGPLLGPLSTAGLMIIFLFFVLLEPSDLRDRFIRLAGSDVHRTTQALSEAAGRVSRYLLMQLVVNTSYGMPLGIGLYLIGVPGAFLWGLMATLLRFVPYLGPFVAALFPITLAIVVDPGWSMLLWTLTLVICIEIIINNVEPWVYGISAGLSPVAVILSVIFWTLLWGPAGLILATPLTVCLVVMGRHVPQLEFIDVLFGSEPVLSPAEKLYQRLLAGNVEEAIEIVETHVAENSLLWFYDQIAVPVLCLAENARQHGASATERRKVAQGMRAIVRDLAEQEGKRNEARRMEQPRNGLTLCIAGRGELDGAASVILEHALESKGIAARSISAAAVTHEAIDDLDLDGAEAVCLLYLCPAPKAYARFVCRRLKRARPHLKIVLCAWNVAPTTDLAQQLADAANADAMAATLEQTVRVAEDIVSHGKPPATVPQAVQQPPPGEAPPRSIAQDLQQSR